MRTSRRHLEDRNQRQAGQIDRLIGERDAAKVEARATATALLRVAGELSDLKDEIALHIVAAEHPSSALSDARSMALSLRESFGARGVDLRLELARLEGADL